MRQRNDLQILRGLAVLFVVLYHLKVPGFERGFLGVDIFFVISGFLMAQLYDKGSVWDFYKRRIDRLLPAYVSVILLTTLVAYFILIPVEFNQLFEQASAAVFFANNFQFWLQDNYFSLSAFNPLLNLWSLSVEVQFYLLVPLLYGLVRSSKTLFALAFFGSLAGCIVMLMLSPKTAFFMMPFRIWEFLAGAYIAWRLIDVPLKRPLSSSGQIAVLLALVAAVFWAPVEPNAKSMIWGHPGLVALAVVVLTAMVIMYEMPKAFCEMFLGRLLKQLGDISYSVYLVHFPVIVLWNYKEFGGTNLYFESVADFALILALTLALSLTLYSTIETRFASLFRDSLSRMLLLASIVPIVLVLSGLNMGRFTDEERAAFAAVTDVSEFRCGKLYPYTHAEKISCTLGEQGHKNSVMLVGNSHADAIKESFTRVANANSYSVSFLVSNQPLLEPGLPVRKIIELAREEGVSALALHYNSQIYTESDFRRNLLELISLAESSGINVVVFEPIPAYEDSVPKTTYEALQSSKVVSQHRVPQSVFDASVTSLLRELDDKPVNRIGLADVFCESPKNCRVLAENRQPIYYDAHHLNLTGAAMLEPVFQKAFDTL